MRCGNGFGHEDCDDRLHHAAGDSGGEHAGDHYGGEAEPGDADECEAVESHGYGPYQSAAAGSDLGDDGAANDHAYGVAGEGES